MCCNESWPYAKIWQLYVVFNGQLVCSYNQNCVHSIVCCSCICILNVLLFPSKIITHDLSDSTPILRKEGWLWEYVGVHFSSLEEPRLSSIFLYTQLACGHTRGSCLSKKMVIRDHRKLLILQWQNRSFGVT